MIGVSASTMSRLAQKQNPDVNAFAKMVRWLNVPAEAFIVEDGRPVNRSPGEEEPELVAQLAPLLRARSDLKPHDVDLLESLIESAVRRFNADRASAGE
jgi:transcriptional regulator with XRE-family HTH domain